MQAASPNTPNSIPDDAFRLVEQGLRAIPQLMAKGHNGQPPPDGAAIAAADEANVYVFQKMVVCGAALHAECGGVQGGV